MGVTEHELKVRLRSGMLERLHDKVVAVAGAPRTWTQSIAAAVLALPGSAASHESSGRILGFFGFDACTTISVLAPLSAHQRVRGVRVHRTDSLRERDIATTNGIRHTARARTIIDLATVVGDGRLQRITEEEFAAKRLSWFELDEAFRAIAVRGRPGVGRLRRVLAAIEGKPPSESKLERSYVELLLAAGIELPNMQVAAPWAEREPGRVDAMYPEARVIIELDGRTFHVRNDAFERDRKRDQLAALNGYVTVRFTYRQITADPDHVVDVTRRLSSRRA